MPKEVPDCPKKPSPTPETARRYQIQLITPMFGGGVHPDFGPEHADTFRRDLSTPFPTPTRFLNGA